MCHCFFSSNRTDRITSLVTEIKNISVAVGPWVCVSSSLLPNSRWCPIYENTDYSIAASNVDCPIMTDVTKKMDLILHSENECKSFEVYRRCTFCLAHSSMVKINMMLHVWCLFLVHRIVSFCWHLILYFFLKNVTLQSSNLLLNK